jgi:type IV pilus assembly protein PilM
MSKTENMPLFHVDKPVFGIDIGFSSVKVMQIDQSKKKPQITGYGYGTFKSSSMKSGVIVDHEEMAKSIYEIVSNNLVGSLSTKRVVAAVPVGRSYNRILSLPHLSKSDLDEAVRLEAKQYIPASLEDLYIDYQVVEEQEETIDVLVVAAPRAVIDSYETLFQILGLETAAVETSINAGTRLVMHAENTDVPTLIIDFGSKSSDLSIFDRALRVTGTVGSGGDNMTDAIAKELGVTKQQAHTIKSKYGIDASKKQKQVIAAVQPVLDKLVAEIKKMDRFYQDRSSSKKIEQVIILGGGANMPGLADYITDKVRVATRMCNPWLNLSFGSIQPPHQLEKTLYATAAGLALVNPKEIDRD